MEPFITLNRAHPKFSQGTLSMVGIP